MNLLVADDHDLVREGIRVSLQQLKSGSNIYEASTADEVEDHLNSDNQFDLVLLDLYMPGTKSFDLLSKIVNEHPHTSVIVISATEDKSKMRKAIDIGASGFISKAAPKDIMMSAIELVLKGGVYIPSDLYSQAKDSVTFYESPEDDYELFNQFEPYIKQLTGRQKEVLILLGKGLSNKGIANELDLSENTIKIHISSIFRVLNLRNRTQAGIIGRILLKQSIS